ncbi:transglutaminase domain protein [Chthoniobacter flavus Ellin428]|uniref:Transglutaminase domain protein n=1 Tax=Chthoniobacter flavus Ellin428 TaxID=497964 RepID=B4CU15_9BACT|nr:transglutaminase family protein [Chthoniobacter flavus]EDY22053.1 transglutaminase domain protein [Chthoniobacter flavus Ellin428]TCO89436.1 transglutaminase-like putative cysteine protease [Chthoniobacter flavus]
MLYDITHRTTYGYGSDVAVSHHLAHLRPRQLPAQQVDDFQLLVEPTSAVSAERVDYYGNTTTFFSIGSPHDCLTVTARSRVRVAAPASPAPSDTLAWQLVRDRCASDVLTPDSAVGEFRFESPNIARRSIFADYAALSFVQDRPLLEAIVDFNARIFQDFKFDPRATTVATPVDEVFKKRRGVCQDFAHLAIACLRSLGLPARYVSGYLETLPPPGKARLIGADASHAWYSVWCPDYGWIDADPTNNLLPGDRHITVAWGRDFSDVSPLRGIVVGGSGHSLGVSVDVARVAEG